MQTKVYIVVTRTRYGALLVEAYGGADSAIEQAKFRVTKNSSSKHSFSELDVKDHIYYAINLNDGIEVFVEEKNIVYTTSSISGTELREWQPGWPPQ